MPGLTHITRFWEDGTINHEKCLYCHLGMPDEKTQHFKDVKLIGKLEILCYRCHYKQSTLHPINANHLVIPSESILAIMEESVKELGVILPLDKEGKVTCPTCHNPHEKGVLPSEESSAQGASEKYRLRLAAQNLQICIACHKDKFKDMKLGVVVEGIHRCSWLGTKNKRSRYCKKYFSTKNY